MIRGGILPRLSETEIRKCDLPSRSNVLGDSIDKNKHHESTGQRKTMKYLREICYHRIECFVANSLAALMRK